MTEGDGAAAVGWIKASSRLSLIGREERRRPCASAVRSMDLLPERRRPRFVLLFDFRSLLHFLARSAVQLRYLRQEQTKPTNSAITPPPLPEDHGPANDDPDQLLLTGVPSVTSVCSRLRHQQKPESQPDSVCIH